MKTDPWTWLNELVQNLIGLGMVAVYLYLVIVSRDSPTELKVFTAAVMVFYGFKAYKALYNSSKQ